MLRDFKDKRVLDLGCGYGWHCIYAMEHGASSVVGVDISHKMLEVAKEKTHFPQVEYKCCAIEDVEFPEESFDVILSSLAFHYVADYEILVKKIYRILKSGGKLVFTVEHPVFTAYGTQDWHYNEKGEILHFPVDNYYYEGKRTAVFLGEKVTKYHRTLTTYLNTLLSNGFIINHIVEPQPPENMMDIPGMQDEMRRPMMLIVDGVYQEKEGPAVAKEILKKVGYNKNIDRICFIIGNHHTPSKIDGLDFQIQWEADLLENLTVMDKEKEQEKIKKCIGENFKTNTGKRIAYNRFILD